MRQWITKWLAKRCRAVTQKRGPDFIIGGIENPYLLRWHVVRWNKFMSIYIHIFVRSDTDEALHDHPWANMSWILDGRYIEWMPYDLKRWPELRDLTPYIRKAGDVVFRKASQPHRVELQHLPFLQPARSIEIPVLSLFVTGPRIREWGFHCPKGWRHWKDFTKFAQQGDSSEIGKGCGE